MRRTLSALVAGLSLLAAAPPANAQHDSYSVRLLVTAYCLSGTTASGVGVHKGAVAVSRSQFRLGRTRFSIPGYGWGIARDTGGSIGWGHIDVWMKSCADAVRWGARHLTVRVY